MTVLDMGCGPGFFTAELARLVGEKGKVIAADLQQEMLDKMIIKVKSYGLEKRVEQHRCQSESIGKVTFMFAGQENGETIVTCIFALRESFVLRAPASAAVSPAV